MKPNKGFTLIELLVVVLIIGILAAIAVPKYQYAVLKTRYNNLKPKTNSLFRAAQAYALANNKWPSSISDLDLSINDFCQVSSSSKYVICLLRKNNQDTMGYLIYSNNSRFCIVYNNQPNSHKLCQEETNHQNPVGGTASWYMYSGTI